MSRRLIWHKEEVQKVVELLLSCKKKEEIEFIFDRILTPREMNDIARRYLALTLLDEGCSYADIMQKTGMSSVTISRLSMKCGYGFRKTSGLRKSKKETPKINKREYKTLKYKGIPVAVIKK